MAGVDFESEAGLVDHYRRVRRKLLNARPGPVIVPAAVPQQAVVVSPLPEIAPAPEPEALPEPGPIIPPQTYPTLATVVRIVSKFYGIDPFDILGRSRAQPLCHRRQVAMYLCREMTKMSLPEIGRRMGSKDHTTILHGCKKIMANMESDDRLRSDIREMRNIIRRSIGLGPEDQSSGCSRMVEAPAFQAGNASSILATRSNQQDVAQPGSASALGAEGRRFDSCHPDQKRYMWVEKIAHILSSLMPHRHQ